MTIFNKKENYSIVNVINEMSNSTLSSVGNKLGINNSIIKNIINTNVGINIIDNYYKDLRLKLSKEHNLKNAPEYIIPKVNSIISYIEYNKLTDNMLANNMSVVSSDTINRISEKLSNEILFYKTDALKLVKRYSNKVDALIKGSKSSIAGSDLYKINTLSKMDILDVMNNKGYLNNILGSTVNTAPVDLSWLAFNGELKDMELNVLRDEELKTLTKADMNNISVLFNTVARSISIEEFNNYIDSRNILNINALTLLVLSLVNKYKVTEDITLLPYVNTAINKLNNLVNSYNDRERLNVVTLNVNNEDDIYIITVLKNTYSDYMSNGGSNKAIFGSIIKRINNTSVDSTPTNTYFNVTVNELNINKEKFINIYTSKVNNLNLELKNKSLTSLRSYYTFALSVVADLNIDRETLKVITDCVNSFDLGTLIDTKTTSLNIFRYFILRDRNFNEFMKGFEEADKIIPDANQDTLVLYAAYRLVLLYLVNQTTLINK